MTSPLAPLYRACLWLAGLFMIALLGTILISIAGRQFDFYIRGIDAYAGYCMAAAAFLALAGTFTHGDHIRVTLVIGRLTGRTRRGFELFCLALAVAVSGAFAFYSIKMTWWSWKFHDISSANDASPLWIPQLGIAVGTTVFALAFIEEFVLVLRGKAPAAGHSDISHTE
ncbi:TRAP transporter small permease [Ferrovibrio sp.]|uniref:TRAP transporter small permease n=1 Tax=Ferrovibrio sp. TaxID=1917215 RepID=UPI00311EB53A